MALSDVEIFEALESGILKISPPPDLTQVGRVSINLHLGPIVHHFKPNPGRGVSVDLSKVKANDWVPVRHEGNRSSGTAWYQVDT